MREMLRASINRESVKSFFMYSMVLWFTNVEVNTVISLEKLYNAVPVYSVFGFVS